MSTDQPAATAPGERSEHEVQRPHRVTVVFNPSSGGGTNEERRKQIRAALAAYDVTVTWHETTLEDPGSGAAHTAVDGGAELVVAAGGDGTVRACAAVLAGTDVPLAVLPSGTGNLVAANFDLPGDLDEAIDIALTCRRRRIDVGTTEAGHFVAMTGIGFDAKMVRDVDFGLKSRIGSLAYVLSALRNLHRRRRRYRISLDGDPPVTRLGHGVLIGNLGRLQGGLPALPDAVPDDGLLDVAVLKSRSMADWLVLTAWALHRWVRPSATGQRPRALETFRARRVEVTCSRPQPVERDGDLDEPSRFLTAEAVPDALTLAVPAHHVERTAPVRREG